MNIRNTLRTRPFVSATIWVFAVLAVMILLTACSTTAIAPPSATAPKAPAAEPVATQEVVEPEDYLVSFGEVFSWEDGISISVSEPTAFTPTQYAAGVVAGGTNVVFTIVLTNNSGKTYEPYVYNTVSSGGAEASSVFDSGNPIGEIGWGPTTTMLDGDSVTWVVAYSVMDPAAIVFEASPGFEYKNVLFTNRLP